MPLTFRSGAFRVRAFPASGAVAPLGAPPPQAGSLRSRPPAVTSGRSGHLRRSAPVGRGPRWGGATLRLSIDAYDVDTRVRTAVGSTWETGGATTPMSYDAGVVAGPRVQQLRHYRCRSTRAMSERARACDARACVDTARVDRRVRCRDTRANGRRVEPGGGRCDNSGVVRRRSRRRAAGATVADGTERQLRCRTTSGMSFRVGRAACVPAHPPTDWRRGASWHRASRPSDGRV